MLKCPELLTLDLDKIMAIIEDEGILDNMSASYSVFYHLSEYRSSILDPFVNDSFRVLEYGAKCGALTKYLSKQCKHVDAFETNNDMVEISKKRLHSENNIDFINTLDLTKKYDLIVMVDLIFTKDEWTLELSRMRDLLNKGGRIVIATDNRLGMRFFSGEDEVFYKVPFLGIEGYPSHRAVTFSYDEWTILLNEMFQLTIYYPYPDHRFSSMLFTDDFLPSKEDFETSKTVYMNSQIVSFQSILAFESLLGNQFKTFSNSFLLVLS